MLYNYINKIDLSPVMRHFANRRIGINNHAVTLPIQRHPKAFTGVAVLNLIAQNRINELYFR
jgi:hypothetical protein